MSEYIIKQIAAASVPNAPVGSFTLFLDTDGNWKKKDENGVVSDVSAPGVDSVTGDGVDNTDPLNPVLSFPTPNEIGAKPDFTENSAFNKDFGTGSGTVLQGDTRTITPTEITTVASQSGTNTGDETDASIKSKYENNPDTNAYTDAEKTKLSGLESSKFVGEFVSLSALQTAFPTAAVGSYAYVDTGVGQPVEKYIWDNNDSQWELQQGQSTAETPATIKTKYESNPDTNAFTDAEKTNLVNQSGTNTNDETTSTIQTKRPIKTVNGQTLEGSGNVVISSVSSINSASFISSLSQNVGTLLNGTGTNIQITLTNILGPNAFGYNIAAGNVTIPTAGWYKISYKCLTESSSNNRLNTRFVIKRNLIDVIGTFTAGYVRNFSNDEASAALSPFIPQFQFSAGDTIGLYAISAGDANQTSFTTSQECVLTIEFLG